ncbi:hypothetical protein [Paenibacillus sp. NEAU-GSW1]|uniref:hypothetical protein n=1 Tax=Paenibacillus sp. NEAU-GSW1 TaxID=2682486 RepID=UPI0012E20631|nr:hypothetical protein [Paenibacillus sp. NEAU-GSW1]MUT65224.1 hypothetical protein [Paenibacillus sp. NEAU-GSW1]
MSKTGTSLSFVNKAPLHVEMIMKNFYRHYPQFFQAGKVELCSKLFYPIALLELEVLESAGEEFDTIEHAVLSLIYAGLNEPEQICDVLGLPLNYTAQMINILRGYGHVAEMSITELGVKSVVEKVKYTKMHVRQKVQADTLTGQLLKKEMVQRVQRMYAPDETNEKIPHIAPLAYLSSESLHQINQVISKYKYTEQAIFHTNAERIEAVIQKEIRYTGALLLKFTHLPHPFVLVQCQNGFSNRKSASYEWRPIAISQSSAHVLHGANDEIETVPDECFASLSQLAEDLRSSLNQSREKNGRKLKTRIEKSFGGIVDADKVSYDAAAAMHINVETPALEKFNRELFGLLESVALSQLNIPYMWLGSDDDFQGMVCYVKTEHEGIRQFSNQLAELWINSPQESDIYNGLISYVDFQSFISIEKLQIALDEVSASNYLKHVKELPVDAKGIY